MRLAYAITTYARIVEPAIYNKYVTGIKNARATHCKGRLFRLLCILKTFSVANIRTYFGLTHTNGNVFEKCFKKYQFI